MAERAGALECARSWVQIPVSPLVVWPLGSYLTSWSLGGPVCKLGRRDEDPTSTQHLAVTTLL